MDLPIPETPNPFTSFAELVAEQHEVIRQGREATLKELTDAQANLRSLSVLAANAAREMEERLAQGKKELLDKEREFNEGIHAVERFWRENPDAFKSFRFEPRCDED